jgi:hypothetical protein
MILAHGSGSQEDQFVEKNGGQKSRDTYYPFKQNNLVIKFAFNNLKSILLSWPRSHKIIS